MCKNIVIVVVVLVITASKITITMMVDLDIDPAVSFLRNRQSKEPILIHNRVQCYGNQ